MGKLFILSVEEDDLETVEKLMDFIASTELVRIFPPHPCGIGLCVLMLRAARYSGRVNS